VDDPGPVCHVHRSGQSFHQLRRLARRLEIPRQSVLQAPAFEQFEGNEGRALDVAQLMDLDDMGIIELGDCLGLDEEPG
jgi:hypothetical protein